MLSAELEALLTKHSNQIDKEHIGLFMKLTNELRTYNYENQPFICVNTIIHKCNCENIYSQSFNICRYQTLYTQYLLTLKLFYFYKRIFKFENIKKISNEIFKK